MKQAELIESKEDAVRVAQDVTARSAEMETIAKELSDDDMLGLECDGTVRLEKLSAENARDARLLAQWILKEHGI